MSGRAVSLQVRSFTLMDASAIQITDTSDLRELRSEVWKLGLYGDRYEVAMPVDWIVTHTVSEQGR